MKKKQRRYASRRYQDSLSVMPKSQSANDTALKNLYQQCNKLTIDKFRDCLSNDLSVLIIDRNGPQPTQEQLQQTWDKIYIESCQLSQNKAYNQIFELQKEIEYLRAKIYLVDKIVEHLQMCYSFEMVEMLNAMLLRCDLKPQHKGATLYNKLKSVVGRAKTWVITLKQRQLDMDKLRKEDTVKMDDSYFDDQLDVIAQYIKSYVSATEITVSRFWGTLNKIHEANIRAEIKRQSNGRY